MVLETLRQRIVNEGQNLGRGILKVDHFVNHQIDTKLMFEMGQEMARPFADAGVTKVITAEISGIAAALITGQLRHMATADARKVTTITMT